MLTMPEDIKALFRRDNLTEETRKNFKLVFYDTSVDALYPYETLYPDDDLYPAELSDDDAWLIIENGQIETESLKISESLCEDTDITFGSCEGSSLEITVADVEDDLTEKEFVLYVEIGGYRMSMGIWTVKSYVRQSDRRKHVITAYDRMSWFDVDVADWYNNLSFPITLKNMRDSLCEYVGIAQVPTDLVFDDTAFTKTIEPEQMTALEVMKCICEINGCFGHVDITGMFEYVNLQQTGLYPAETLYPEEDLYPSQIGGDGEEVETISTYKQPMEYEDYLVEGIDSLTIRQEEDDIGASYGNGENTYVIEGNFLAYGKSAAELLSMAQTIYPIISGRTYRPATIDCNCMPWVEVGDAVLAPTTDDVVETFVMKRTISGMQNMRDEIVATGNKTRENQTTVHSLITQLEGKTTKITRTVDEVSVRVTDLKEYTEAQVTILSDQISLKVSKGEVTSQLNIEPDQVILKSNRLIVESTNFQLDGSGNATFSGKITGGTINIGSNFSVDSSGNMVATSAKLSGAITGGTINIGSNFSVDSSGNMVATSATLKGNISGSSISGSSISGSTIDVGPFAADDDSISLGDYSVSADSSNVFQSNDGSIVLQTKSGGPLGSYPALELTESSGSTVVSGHHVNTSNMFAYNYYTNGEDDEDSDYYYMDWYHGLGYWVNWLYDEVS